MYAKSPAAVSVADVKTGVGPARHDVAAHQIARRRSATPTGTCRSRAPRPSTRGSSGAARRSSARSSRSSRARRARPVSEARAPRVGARLLVGRRLGLGLGGARELLERGVEREPRGLALGVLEQPGRQRHARIAARPPAISAARSSENSAMPGALDRVGSRRRVARPVHSGMPREREVRVAHELGELRASRSARRSARSRRPRAGAPRRRSPRRDRAGRCAPGCAARSARSAKYRWWLTRIELRALGEPARLRDEAALEVRAARADPRIGRRRDLGPQRRVLGEPLDLGAIAGLRVLGPVGERAERDVERRRAARIASASLRWHT